MIQRIDDFAVGVVGAVGIAVDPALYTVTYSNENSKNAGKYTVTVEMNRGSGFSGDACTMSYLIKKAANKLSVSGKKATIKYKKLKKKAQTLKPGKIIRFKNKGQGAKKYTLASAKKGNKNFLASKVKTVTVRVKKVRVK